MREWNSIGETLKWNPLVTALWVFACGAIILADILGAMVLWRFGRELKGMEYRESRQMMIIFAVCTGSFGFTTSSTGMSYFFGGVWYLVEVGLLVWTSIISLYAVWFLRKLYSRGMTSIP